jgi:hypothetical protein
MLATNGKSLYKVVKLQCKFVVEIAVILHTTPDGTAS